MCGISGFVAGYGRMLPNRLVYDMSNIIHHRGPDDEGFMVLDENNSIITAGGKNTPNEVWSELTEFRPTNMINDIFNKKSSLAFGHKRLAILDLTPTGHQPMSYKNGRLWIVFNGEIYNYAGIRDELKNLGHNFNTRTDTEVVLAAFSEWGEE